MNTDNDREWKPDEEVIRMGSLDVNLDVIQELEEVLKDAGSPNAIQNTFEIQAAFADQVYTRRAILADEPIATRPIEEDDESGEESETSEHVSNSSNRSVTQADVAMQINMVQGLRMLSDDDSEDEGVAETRPASPVAALDLATATLGNGPSLRLVTDSATINLGEGPSSRAVTVTVTVTLTVDPASREVTVSIAVTLSVDTPLTTSLVRTGHTIPSHIHWARGGSSATRYDPYARPMRQRPRSETTSQQPQLQPANAVNEGE